jgi:hypothetical protein
MRTGIPGWSKRIRLVWTHVSLHAVTAVLLLKFLRWCIKLMNWVRIWHCSSLLAVTA